MVKVVVSGDQATLASLLSSLFFATPPFFCVPTLHTFSWGMRGPWGTEHLTLLIFGGLSTEDAVRLLPLLLTWRMEITQAFENTCRERSLLSPQEDYTFLKGRACYRLQKKGLCGNERDSGLWSCSKSAAFLTFRSQQRWKTPGQPLHSLGKKIQRLDKYFALINSICLIKQSLPTTKAGKIFYITLSTTSKRLLWAWFEQLFPQPRMWRNAKLHSG